tara:strand:+ start:35106 stop:35636 length:531 start_codon:yes stop_codon:yes gene_type:complete
MSASLIGLNATLVTLTTSVPAFKPGTIGGFDDTSADGTSVLGYKEFIYGTATAAITGLGYACVEGVLNANFSMITTANTAAGQLGGHGSRVGIAQAAMATGDFGWFQIVGKGSLRVAASAAIGTRLNTTATAGVLDDDGTAASRAINGVNIKTVNGGAEATSADARFSYPTVGVTL